MQIRTMTFVIAVVMISLGSVQSTADVIIEVEPLTPQVSVLPSCTVEICCTGIGGSAPGGAIAWHCFTKCTKSKSGGVPEVTACNGGPSGLFRDLVPEVENPIPGGPQLNPPPDCSGNGLWGPVYTYCGPWDRTHPDYPKNEAPQPFCRDVTTGTDCNLCDCIKKVMDCIELCCVNYELVPDWYGYNSNSAAYTAISACQTGGGGPIALPDGLPWLGAPGWGIVIPLCPECP